MDMKIAPEEVEPALYSSNIIATFLKLIRSKYSYVNITELLEYAGMEPYQVEDVAHWFTQTQVDRFYERLVETTKTATIAKEAGRFSAFPENMALMNRYVLAMIDPAKVFAIVGKIAESYTKSAKYEAVRKSSTRIEVIVTPYDGVREKQYQCENRIGHFEAIVYGLNYQYPRIEHTECIFRGDKACRYILTWRDSKAKTVKRIRNWFPFVAAAGLGYLHFALPAHFGTAAVASSLAFFALSATSEYLEKRELRTSLNHLRSTTERYFENTESNYNNALMVNEVGRIISKEIKIETLLPQIIETLKRRLDYDRGLIMLADPEGSRLRYATGFGYDERVFGELEDAGFHLDREESRGIFVVCYREKRPFLVNDVDTISGDLSKRSLAFVRRLGSKAFICCPILYEDECLGVLAVDNLKSKRPLLESDMNLLMGIAQEIGISVHNALVTEERERQFDSILKTLAASIDARDSLTAGHSENVTEYSMALCRELEVPQEYAEVVRVAAQLHDYGKIGIKDAILKKSGPLTRDEREEIKKHVVKTKEILDRINFGGAFRDVPRIAGAHHEWMDGSGYPDGLAGEAIPLGSRIIAVADFYEAITARRHYRDPMAGDEAVQTLTEARGTHLDARIVDAMLKLLAEKKEAVLA